MINKTFREFMEEALDRDSRDLPSQREIEMSQGVFSGELEYRDPDATYYYFWPMQRWTDQGVRKMTEVYHGANGYKCFVLQGDEKNILYAFHRPDRPLRIISLNRMPMREDELLLVCENEVEQGGGNERRAS
ncbi:MAG: hypothetical protein ABIH92_05085 [Nanoarchaeota archaeon]